MNGISVSGATPGAVLCRLAEVELKAAEVIADLGVRPVRVAHNLAADHTPAIDDVSLRPTLGPIHLRNRLLRVADRGHVNVIPGDEPAVGSRVLVDADRKDRKIGPIVVQLLQRRRLLDAGRTPTPPDVQQHYFAPVIRQADGVFSVADREVRRNLIRVGRARPAIAAASERQSNQ